MIYDDKTESFIEAFKTNSGHSRHSCDCGKEFYDSDGGWDWEDGELEGLMSTGIDLGYSVGLLKFEGKTFVIDCDCWLERAKMIMEFLDSHSHGIARYMNLEKIRKIEEAKKMPEVEDVKYPRIEVKAFDIIYHCSCGHKFSLHEAIFPKKWEVDVVECPECGGWIKEEDWEDYE